ncbi:uncharacterized protein LOC115623180 [Scaptodrosophila lebanonensis]|uniref:Uncharacterized protein LOC115623180 n=1 Tax=Drosophila lebanonensis TaxID=7225 RepID=A0A6J2T8N1_DROLE|nr:uncharacterized protein LOC115623180 [Scaptodrosophila lebanonensis]XP_030373261.1 uncharacterized protein LOC115623180 [Scaptodrosophila lebanonensis]
MHIVYTYNAGIINLEYAEPTSTSLIFGSFSMFVIFTYLKLLYILVAIYVALHVLAH